jgi:hypothetical protein
MYQCNACREPFTAMIGTVMASRHIPMTQPDLGAVPLKPREPIALNKGAVSIK